MGGGGFGSCGLDDENITVPPETVDMLLLTIVRASDNPTVQTAWEHLQVVAKLAHGEELAEAVRLQERALRLAEQAKQRAIEAVRQAEEVHRRALATQDSLLNRHMTTRRVFTAASKSALYNGPSAEKGWLRKLLDRMK